MFKVGQKVVFTGEECINKSMNYPQINEIVVIKSVCNVHDNAYDLIGYEFAKDGRAQSFRGTCLRPLDETFADEVLERVKEEINKEELVLI